MEWDLGSAAVESNSVVNNKTAYVSSKEMHTKDPYLGMEVIFQGKTKLKGHRGLVMGSQLNEHLTVPKAATTVNETVVNETSDNETNGPTSISEKTVDTAVISTRKKKAAPDRIFSGEKITVTVKMLTQSVNTIVQEKIVNLVDTK